MKEMELGVTDVYWMLVGAWTTGLAIEKNIALACLLHLFAHCKAVTVFDARLNLSVNAFVI